MWKMFWFFLALCPLTAPAGEIAIPMPEGAALRIAVDNDYIRLSERDPEMFGAMARVGSRGSFKVVEYLYAESDFAAIEEGENSVNSIYKIGIDTDYRNKRIDANEWRRLRPVIKASIAGIDMEKMKAQLEAHLNSEIDRELSETLGTEMDGVARIEYGEDGLVQLYGDDPQSVRFFVRIPATFDFAGEKEQATILSFGAVINVEGQVVILGSESNAPEDDAGLQRLREKFDRVVDSVIFLNARTQPALGMRPGVHAPAVSRVGSVRAEAVRTANAAGRYSPSLAAEVM